MHHLRINGLHSKKNKVQSLNLAKPILQALLVIGAEPEPEDIEDEAPARVSINHSASRLFLIRLLNFSVCFPRRRCVGNYAATFPSFQSIMGASQRIRPISRTSPPKICLDISRPLYRRVQRIHSASSSISLAIGRCRIAGPCRYCAQRCMRRIWLHL